MIGSIINISADISSCLQKLSKVSSLQFLQQSSWTSFSSNGQYRISRAWSHKQRALGKASSCVKILPHSIDQQTAGPVWIGHVVVGTTLNNVKCLENTWINVWSKQKQSVNEKHSGVQSSKNDSIFLFLAVFIPVDELIRLWISRDPLASNSRLWLCPQPEDAQHFYGRRYGSLWPRLTFWEVQLLLAWSLSPWCSLVMGWIRLWVRTSVSSMLQ